MALESARPARTEDLPHCRVLLTAALADARAVRGGATLAGPLTEDDLLARWAGPDRSTVLLAGEFNHAVVGVGAATTLTRAGSTRPSGSIECCYVESAARGVGVGSVLMASLVEWCRAQECGDIDALALPGDRSTKQRLEAAGFTARLLTLNRPLD
jgi:GNAT superfamily N-acetyltransferase